MARTTLTLKGDTELRAKLEAAARQNAADVRRALYEEAEDIMRAAKEITPVATPELSGYSGGALRASGHVKPPVETPLGGMHVEMGFGGAAAPYAVYVHERIYAPSGKKVRHAPGKQAKFLEQPFFAASAGMLARLAARLRR